MRSLRLLTSALTTTALCALTLPAAADGLVDLPQAPVQTELKNTDATGSGPWRRLMESIYSQPHKIDEGLGERPAHSLSTLEVRRNVLVMVDDDGSIFENSFIGPSSNATLNEITRQTINELGNIYDFITVIIDWNVTSVFAYYMPLANDVAGIGYKNLTPDGTEIFDETQGPLQGFIFMNNWRIYTQGDPNLSRIVWLQEIGHRWGAFTYYDKGNGQREDMLGRDLAHWSYFMQSHNSALEGNDWEPNPDGTFSTFTNASRMTYSSLDLYTMGLLPPEEVEDWFVIREPVTGNLRDERGARINRASPPETSGEIKTIDGVREDIGIQDVIAAEGPRQPDHTQSKRTWRMATVFIVRDERNADERTLTQVEELVDFWEDMFEEGTNEQMNLITALDGQELAEDVPFGEPCQASEQCDPATATTCLSVDDDTRICSRRCFADGECGEGFCCDDPQDSGALFCYPSDGACPSQDDGNNDTGDDGNNDTGDDGNNDTGDNDEEPRGNVSSAARDSGGCQSAPGAPTPLGALFLLAMTMAAVWRRGRV